MDSATPNGSRLRAATAVTRSLPVQVGAQEMAFTGAAHSIHSSAREKVLEHIFLADLLRALWLGGVHDVQVLRPEVDRNGYEFMLVAKGARRSIQLKTTRRDGKAREVPVNRHLEDEPSGCVIWMFFDEQTLELGPFLFLGLQPGKGLHDLGDKVAKHPRRNKDGIRPVRPGIRLVGRARFTEFQTIEEVARALFGKLAPPRAARSAPTARS